MRRLAALLLLCPVIAVAPVQNTAGAQTHAADGHAHEVHAVAAAPGAAATHKPTTTAVGAPLAQKGMPRYVLWDITPMGIDNSTARSLFTMLRGELRKILGDNLIDSDRYIDREVRGHLDTCGETTECLSQLAGAIGAARLVTGTVAAIGDTYGMNLKLVDALHGEDLARARASLSGSRNDMLLAVQTLIYQLVDPRMLIGALIIESTMDGAEVSIDGNVIGTTPLPRAIEGLTAGEHVLKLTAPLMEDYMQFVTVHRGKTSKVIVDARQIEALEARLSAAQQNFYQQWWFWPAVGATVSAVIGGTLWGMSSQEEAKRIPPAGSLGSVDVRGIMLMPRRN